MVTHASFFWVWGGKSWGGLYVQNFGPDTTQPFPTIFICKCTLKASVIAVRRYFHLNVCLIVGCKNFTEWLLKL